MQKSNETLRDYIHRWITLHHIVENVSDHQAVCAFKEGIKNRELSLKFDRTGDMTLSRMMEIATKYATVKKKIDSAAESVNQSVKTLAGVIPIRNRSVRPSLQHPTKLRQ